SMAYMRENGLPNFPSAERAMRVIAHMAAYEEYKKQRGALEVKKASPKAGVKGALLEHEAMALLKENGINTPEFRFVMNRDAAAARAKEIGYPVVMKVVSPEILHKSDVGGVKLNIADDMAAKEAFDALEKVGEGKGFQGVVMYPMLKGGTEVILGLTVDRQFGPVVAFGMGGIYTEILRDIVLSIAPVNEAGAMEMIKKTKAYQILLGARGQKGVDIKALANMIAAFSQLPFLYPEIQEADLNPVFAFPDGAYVGDVRIII
ncbi:acetate--CoA ligase family protein, partial [Christensenellaceae bacterium OttesenSCG-928-M15]|nr:acetate--CoA ligase family protein [Christensenellaceae bacterium OttesenSCG-928-M15]